MSFTHRVIKNKSKVKNHVTPICANSVSAMLTLLLLAVSYCACSTQPDMRSSHCAVSAWHQPAGPKNKMFGRDLRWSHSQSVVVMQVNVFWYSARICWLNIFSSNLSGYLTHVVEWTGAIWPSSSFRSAVVVPRILQAEKLDSCRQPAQWISANIDALPCTVNCRLFLERSAWNWTIKCVLTTVYWTGPLEQRLTVLRNCNRLPWEI